MLTLHPHAGHTVTPSNLWSEWQVDPVLSLLVAGAVLGFLATTVGGARRATFLAGMTVIAAALLSPLDAAAESLASAHMVQHLLLTLVAAPLIAWSRPLEAVLRAGPRAARKSMGRFRRKVGLTPARLSPLRHPAAAFLVHAAVLWTWHAALFYEAALTNESVHVLQHLTFLGSAVWLWTVVLSGVWSRRSSLGAGILTLFGTSLQGVLLSAMMTFSHNAWYTPYRITAPLWGLDPVQDQQLAGLIMWIPSGLVYTVAALVLLARWLSESELAGRRSLGRVEEHP